ncbi:hypothetical protein T484DRAFT_1811189 [Baffinella frigidus]|nr:hypothetical protein T484DRAFT_1811189 [Cryptophyta sp. CCMP2293]
MNTDAVEVGAAVEACDEEVLTSGVGAADFSEGTPAAVPANMMGLSSKNAEHLLRKSSFVVYFAPAGVPSSAGAPSSADQTADQEPEGGSGVSLNDGVSPQGQTLPASRSPVWGPTPSPASPPPSSSPSSSHTPAEADSSPTPPRTLSSSSSGKGALAPIAEILPAVLESDICLEPFPSLGDAFMARLPEFSLNCTTPYKHQATPFPPTPLLALRGTTNRLLLLLPSPQQEEPSCMRARELSRYGKDKVAKPCTAREAW